MPPDLHLQGRGIKGRQDHTMGLPSDLASDRVQPLKPAVAGNSTQDGHAQGLVRRRNKRASAAAPSNASTKSVNIAAAVPPMAPTATIPSAEELLRAKEALASVQVLGTSCLGEASGDGEGVGNTDLAGGTGSDCVLLTSSGSRKLPGSCNGGGGGGKRQQGATASRLAQLRREVEMRMPTPSAWRARLREDLQKQRDSPDSRLSPVVEVAVLLAECIKVCPDYLSSVSSWTSMRGALEQLECLNWIQRNVSGQPPNDRILQDEEALRARGDLHQGEADDICPTPGRIIQGWLIW